MVFLFYVAGRVRARRRRTSWQRAAAAARAQSPPGRMRTRSRSRPCSRPRTSTTMTRARGKLHTSKSALHSSSFCTAYVFFLFCDSHSFSTPLCEKSFANGHLCELTLCEYVFTYFRVRDAGETLDRICLGRRTCALEKWLMATDSTDTPKRLTFFIVSSALFKSIEHYLPNPADWVFTFSSW